MNQRDLRLPARGASADKVLEDMRAFRGDDVNYKESRTFSLVYYLGEEHTEFLKQAHGLYFSENALNPMAFQSLKRFEHEVVRMSHGLFHGPAEGVGCMTSGGTESCMLAVQCARDRARAQRRLPFSPEMILPRTAHVAFEKAAHYFGVKAVHAPLTDDFRVDLRAVKKLINRNTILLVGSAVSYPQGMVDDIPGLSRLALKHHLPLHVDCCLGGFMLPFVEKLGYPVPPFDFRVPGVTSISADIHKYGYAAKGASVILYRSMADMHHQFFAYTDWPGGIYASPALLGTRPGGSIAAAWGAMMHLGEDGYLALARTAMDATVRLVAGVNAIDGLKVLGSPVMTVFSYASTDPDLNIYAVGDQMEQRGWHIDRNQNPAALHAMITPRHAEIVDRYLADLRDSTAAVRANPELRFSGKAATYGMVAAIPLRGMVRNNVIALYERLYRPDGGAVDMDAAGQEQDLATRAGLALLKLKDRLERRRARRR